MGRHLETSTSVGLLLANGFAYKDRLILAQKRVTGLWGLVAGGLEEGEDEEAAMWRELREETDLTRGEVEIDFRHPRIKISPQTGRSSTGIIFKGVLKATVREFEKEVPGPEIARVRSFSIGELVRLVQEGDGLYRPDFNRPIIKEWAQFYIDYNLAIWEGLEFARKIKESLGIE
jgi:8-oxo-dGTP pyrophosphatase MutT (NUDIX family)